MGNRRKRRDYSAYLLTYDMNLIVAVIFLIVFGLVMIYSASYYTAGMSKTFHNDPTYLLKSQLKYSLLGLVAMLVAANIDYHKWRYFAALAFLGSIVLILLLKVPGLGVTVKGATRWIRVPGLGQFQVAEPIKVAMIVFSAALISKYATKLNNLKMLVKLLIPTAIIFVMIWIPSDHYPGLDESLCLRIRYSLSVFAGTLCHRFRRPVWKRSGEQYPEAGTHPGALQ